MGFHAVELLAQGKTNRVVCTLSTDEITDVDIAEGLSMKKTINEQQMEVLTAMTGV